MGELEVKALEGMIAKTGFGKLATQMVSTTVLCELIAKYGERFVKWGTTRVGSIFHRRAEVKQQSKFEQQLDALSGRLDEIDALKLGDRMARLEEAIPKRPSSLKKQGHDGASTPHPYHARVSSRIRVSSS